LTDRYVSNHIISFAMVLHIHRTGASHHTTAQKRALMKQIKKYDKN